jgi:hypothetical protein
VQNRASIKATRACPGSIILLEARIVRRKFVLVAIVFSLGVVGGSMLWSSLAASVADPLAYRGQPDRVFPGTGSHLDISLLGHPEGRAADQRALSDLAAYCP